MSTTTTTNGATDGVATFRVKSGLAQMLKGMSYSFDNNYLLRYIYETFSF